MSTRSEPAELDLEALTALDAAATPGPWEVIRDTNEVDNTTIRAAAGWFEDLGHRLYGVRFIAELAEGNTNEADADLIAAARNALPELIAGVRRLQDLVGEVLLEKYRALGERTREREEARAEVTRLTDEVRRLRDLGEEGVREKYRELDRLMQQMDAARAHVARLTAELAEVTGQRDDALQVLADLRPHVGEVAMGDR